jgi:hypothetical protein
MGRLVQPQARPGDSTRSGGSYEATSGSRDGDEYASRVAKYIPSEVLAGYLTLEGLLGPVQSSAETGSAPRATSPATGIISWVQPEHIAAGIFLVGLVFTPLYILTFGLRNKVPWVTHAIMATLAFCVWAYAMKGSFLEPFYNGSLAAAILVVFSLISGLIKPNPPTT